jgi:signal transduction histidine kinase
VGLLQLNDTRRGCFTLEIVRFFEELGASIGIALARIKAEEEVKNLAKFPSENPNPVLRITKEGKLLYANNASNSLLSEWGCQEGQMVPSYWCQAVSEAFTSGKQKRVETKHLGKTFSFEIAPVSEADYANLYGRDITERKQAEKNLQKSLADLERSNKELQQFAYVASHDLQEPLRMVASFTQLLEKRYSDKLDTDAKEFIGFAVDGANRMQRLINDLLAFSRLGTKREPFKLIDCHAILSQAIANLNVAIRENHAITTDDNLPTVTADPAQMKQLFQNLIGNAIKFRRDESPRIHVSAERKENEWVFSVRDNGIGIEQQYKNRIFEIFQRLHSRDEYPGTGIGLAICKRIVERHGGRIWVESEAGKGSTFFFTLRVLGDKKI